MPNALITGATSGIGRATAIALARQGYHIVAAVRNQEKASQLVEEIRANGGSGEYLHLDLATLDSVRETARLFEQSNREVDVLINNAAAGPRRGLTSDGFELQFGVNHLGHFMLTHHLRRSFHPGTRIIQVTSSIYERADGIDWGRVISKSRSLLALREYAVSKLANVLFVRELAQQQPDWRTYAVHPGLTDTSIIPGYARPFLRKKLHSPEVGAATVVWCATDQSLGQSSGGYYANKKERAVTDVAADSMLSLELRRRSEAWCDVAPQH
jgi:retinol dehydrogenase-12